MTGCSAPNCTNRASKGFKLHQFPANKARRHEWLKHIKRDNWTPTKNSRLCDAHFAEDQFELQRMDGKIKLKPNAVPTIFHYSDKKPTEKPRFEECKNKLDEKTTDAFNKSTCDDNKERSGYSDSFGRATCKVKNCSSYKNSPPVHSFPFPSSEARCQDWVERSQNDELVGVDSKDLHKTAYLCAEHFEDSQFTDGSKTVLNPDALPTIFPGHFVSVPSLEDASEVALQDDSRAREYVKNEPLWSSSPAPTVKSDDKLTYPKLLKHASEVKLPSTLWALHRGKTEECVAFTCINIPGSEILVERALVFRNTCRANVYFKGRKILMGMGEVKTLQEVEALLDQLSSLEDTHSSSSAFSSEI